MKTSFDLSGRVAVVVGATSGLGRELALGLANHGAGVVVSGRRMNEAQQISAEIEKRGSRSLAFASDVTDRASLVTLRDSVINSWERVDILVNAAGYTQRKDTLSVTDAEWDGIFNTNLDGILRACQTFHAALRDSQHARIINIASLGSYLAFHEVAAYCASKSAVLSLTRSLACEWAKDGIRVNAIAPGVFPTELNSKLLDCTPRGKEILMRTPMQRFGKPEELVGAAVLLASDGASFITGQCLAVDGGYLASGVNV